MELAKEKAGNFFNDTVNATKKFSENLAGNLRKTDYEEVEEEEIAKPITPLEQEIEDGLVIQVDIPEEESPSESLATVGTEEAPAADSTLPVNAQEIVAEDLEEEEANEEAVRDKEEQDE